MVNRLAGDLERTFIVVGATARESLLFHVFGILVTRRLRTSTLLSRWIRGKGFEGYGRHCLRVVTLTKVDQTSHLPEGTLGERRIPVDLIPSRGSSGLCDPLASELGRR